MPGSTTQSFSKSESAARWNELTPGRWFCLMILLFLWIFQVGCQDCDFPGTLVFDIKETDPAGTELFNVSSHNGTNVFTYTAETWLTEFLNLTLNDTDLYYHMRLSKPLDLEEIYYNLSVTDISGFSFTLNCKSHTDRHQFYHIIVEAVNEWPPEFNTTSIHLSVKETLPVRSVVINLTQWSDDKDVHPVSREIAGYSLLRYTGDPQIDGLAWLDMLAAYDGIVVVKKELDYEALPPDKKYLLLGVQINDQGGQSATASLTVHVEDGDDLPPLFTYPGCWQPCRVTYSVSVSPDFVGLVSGIKPAPIEAHDGDTLHYAVEYHIVQGPEYYEHYMDIDKLNGNVFILQALNATGLSTVVLIVEAREVSQNARSTRTTLLISVQSGTQDATVISSTVSNDNTVIIVSVILGAVVIIVTILLIIMVVYTKKRSKKPVFPANSMTTIQGGLSVRSSVELQASKTQTNKEMHVEQAGLPTILDNKDYGYADIEPSGIVGRQTVHPPLDRTGNNGTPWMGKTRAQERPTSDPLFAFDADHVDHFGPVPQYLTHAIRSQPASTYTEVVHLATNNSDTRESKAHAGPTLRVISGLIALQHPQGLDSYDVTFDNEGGYPSISGTSNASHLDLKADSKPIFRSSPKRKKSSRKSSKPVPDQQESICDRAEIVGNVEFNSGFYTDSTTRRIKQLTGKRLDPEDTRYWLTVQDDC